MGDIPAILAMFFFTKFGTFFSSPTSALSSKSPEYGEAHPQVSGHHCRARRPDKPTMVPHELPIDTMESWEKTLVTVKGLMEEIPNNHLGWLKPYK